MATSAHQRTPSKGHGDEETVGIEVIEGKGLVSMDSNGLSDPYVKILAGTKKLAQTKTVKKSLSPVWSEAFFVAVPSGVSAIDVECWDWDMLKKDDRMGTVRIPLDSLLPMNTTRDDWYTLKPMRDGDPVSGTIHLKITRFAPSAAVVGTGTVAELTDERMYPTPLFRAVESGDLLGVMTMLGSGKYDVNQRNGRGNTICHIACTKSENEYQLLAVLSHSSVDASATNVDGNTPLHIFAKSFRNPNVEKPLKMLLERGGNVNSANALGETPLHSVVFNPSIRVLLADMLLKRGAKINAQTSKGATPLHYAVMMSRLDLVTLFVQKEADMDLKDSDGKKPIDIASDMQQQTTLTRLSDSQALSTYLDSIGLGAYKCKFFERKLFKYRLRTAVTDAVLFEIGIKIPEQRKVLIELFKEIKDVDPRSSMMITRPSPNPLPAAAISDSDIEFQAMLGEGSSAKVFRAKYKGESVAIKVIEGSSPKEEEEFLREFEIVRRVESKNVLRMIGVLCAKNKLSMIMELAERGSLYHFLADNTADITWKLALSFIEQATSGLLALHKNDPPILHRDLKTLNLLVTSDMTLKLCDFGLSRFNTAENLQTLQRVRGTYAYLAPETFTGALQYTDRSDVFSLGIIFWEIVNRCITKKYMRPYEEFPEVKLDFQIIYKVTKDDVRPTIPQSTPPAMRNIIQLCILKDGEARPSCEDVMNQVAEVADAYKKNPSDYDMCVARS